MRKVKWSNISTLISIAFIVLTIASLIDINIHNGIGSAHYGEYANWNIFNILFN
jgi:hypothetical protein